VGKCKGYPVIVQGMSSMVNVMEGIEKSEVIRPNVSNQSMPKTTFAP